MVFSSIDFLFYFLPPALALCLLVPARFKNAALFICSAVFCLWGEPRMFPLMLAQLLAGFFLALAMEKRPKNAALMWLGAAVSLVPLLVFKYAGFFMNTLGALTGTALSAVRFALPLGVSFYSFQLLGYLADVWRGDAKAQRNIIDYLCYMLMFMQFTQGPILSYKDFAPQLKDRRVTAQDLAAGLQRTVLGLAKKILVADVLANFVKAYTSAHSRSVAFAWGYAAAVSLQLYYDFSGYSDIALGLGRMLGFRFDENFTHPFVSRSITEFWRRWHMSLGRWFKEYIYFPLGGNRVSRARWFFNIFVVWATTGLWHGAAWNYVLWGLLFALLLVAEKLALLKVLEKSRVLCRVYVLFFVAISFALFSAADFSAAWADICAMFGAGVPLVTEEARYYLASYGPLLVFAAVGSTELPAKLMARLKESRAGSAVRVLCIPALMALFVLCAAYLADGSFAPFLYNQY
ncbi:MAG: MBOAT family protein [Oscillospiraceae bacterium]|nr:MBOAT family protein [Oscillospiraceae bacterium]